MPETSLLKKIGIVGGVSWLSTVEYYRIICELSHRNQVDRIPKGPPAVPEMAIESLNINKSFNLRGELGNADSWRDFDGYFRNALERLQNSGAELAIIASNTPHNRFDSITKGIDIPVINIFDVVAQECARLGFKKALILGTAPTMTSPVFPSILAANGITPLLPKSDKDSAAILQLIEKLQADEETVGADIMRTVALASLTRDSIPESIVCLSCTELPLAFPKFLDEPTFKVQGIWYLNTTLVHAKAAFEYAAYR